MHFLRVISTRRLIALCVAVVALGAGGTAIALAAGGGGPVPPPKPLAQAIHDAAAAPAPAGVTARIKFTNKLVDASSLQGAVTPLLSGATGRLWASADGHVRLELQSDSGDAQILSDGHTVSVYDAQSNTVYRAMLPASHDGSGAPDQQGPPTVAAIQQQLARLAQQLDLSGAIPGDVAGRPAYTVRVTPKHDGGLLGAAELAWDADNGVPLRAAVYAQGSDSPVLELEATDISFGSVPASSFDVPPPANAKTVTLDTGAATGGSEKGVHADVTGVDAVSTAVPFTLSAPDQLAGLPRHEVRLLDWKGHPAALVTYGQGFGGVVVIEQAADGAAAPGADHSPLPLPTVSIGGVTGHELDTALGTLVTFSRGGVDYTVIGSVPPAAAEAAARGL